MVGVLNPVIEVDLVKVRSHRFLAQFVDTKKGYIEPRKNCDERLEDVVGFTAAGTVI